MLEITPTGQACGAVVRGVDFCADVSTDTLKTIRSAWLAHHVLIFPNQTLDNDRLVRFAEYFGPIGDDPYFAPIEGHDRIAAVRREADETAPLFAEVWHSDWSFMSTPPAATCLYGLDIPPIGGDTLFANEHKAWEEMSESLRQKLSDKMACHSAKRAYSKEGRYSKDTYKGSMSIRPSDSALASQSHPLIRPIPRQAALAYSAVPTSMIWKRRRKTRRESSWWNYANGSIAPNLSTGTSGRRTCWSCGTIAVFFTRRPAVMRGTRGCFTASPSPTIRNIITAKLGSLRLRGVECPNLP